MSPHTSGTLQCSPLEPPSTLPAALGALGEGLPILPHPVVVERGLSDGVAVQGDGAALWHRSAQGVHTHGQGRRRPHGDTALPPHHGITRVTRGTAAGNMGALGLRECSGTQMGGSILGWVHWGVYGDEHFGIHRVGILGCVWVCILGYRGWVYWGEHITVSTSG